MSLDLTEEEKEALIAMKANLSKVSTLEGRTKAFSLRPSETDTFIVTPPKCGTTWISQICHQLRTGGDMDFDEIARVIPWLELAVDIHIDLEGPQRASPRLFKSHGWYPIIPKGARYIYVIRDPYATVLSFYNFLEGWFFAPGSLSLTTFVIGFWLARGVPAERTENASYFDNLASWWPHRNDPNVLFLFYENVILDTEATVRKINSFLGFKNNEETIQTAIRMSSREFMVEHRDKFNENIMRHERNEACGLDATAGSTSYKVVAKPETKPELSEQARTAIDKRWKKTVQPVTGFATYEDMLKASRTNEGNNN